MVMSSWPSERSVVNSQTPAAVPIMPPASSMQAEREIDRVAPPIAQHAGEGGRGDMGGDAGHRDARRDAEEDQQRRHQESAADAEHAGDESDREPHGQNDEDIDRQVCDRKIDLHGLDDPYVREAAGLARAAPTCNE